MASFLERLLRFLCAAQAGVQLCFVIAATQVLFRPEIAALPHGDPRRELAAAQVGQLLLRVDILTILVTAVALSIAWALARREAGSLRRALLPLLAGLCASASLFGTTPAIQALRAANRTDTPNFAAMHALSTTLLLLELLLFAWAALRPHPDGSSPMRLRA